MVQKLNVNNAEDLDAINSFLERQDIALLYCSSEYIVLLHHYIKNSSVELWVVKDKERIIGYLPVMFKDNLNYGIVCNSLPFYGSNGGAIVCKEFNSEQKNEIRNKLLEAVLKSIKEKRCIAATFITNPLDSDFNKWIGTNLSYQLTDERIGQLTPLPQVDSDSIENVLLASFEDPRPRNIRKAQKEGVVVYTSYDDVAFDFLYQTHYENITSINGIPKEKEFFELVKKNMPRTMYRIYIAEKDGEKIGALLFYFNKTVEYFTPAIVEKTRSLQASSLLIYKAMVDAAVDGYHWWNWGGTWLTQGGVYDFKKKWGTLDFPYYYYTCIYDSSVLLHSKDVLLKEYPFFFVAPFGKLKKE